MANLTKFNNKNTRDFFFNGKAGSLSRRKLAELCGVEHTTILYWLNKSGAKSLPEKLKILEQYDLRSGAEQIPDIVCEAFIAYYAFEKKKEVALRSYRAFAAIGIRDWIKQKSGYKEPEFKLPQTYAQALRELAATVEENERLKEQALLDKPKVEFAETVSVSDDLISMNEYAKMIGTGRNKLFKRLRELGVIMKHSTLPYQKHIDAGYFEVSELITEIGLQPYCVITGKGQLWLHQKLGLKGKLASQLKLDF